MRRLLLKIAAAMAALGLALPAVAGAAGGAGPLTLIRGVLYPHPSVATLKQYPQGTFNHFSWGLTAYATSRGNGSSRVPMLCVNFSFYLPGKSLGGPVKGTLFGNAGQGNLWCAGAATKHSAAGPWIFQLAGSEYNGLTPPGIVQFNGSHNRWRAMVFLVDPRATRVVASLADGEHLRIATHSVPASLHRPSKFALAVTKNTPKSKAATKVVRAVAYDASGQVVGRMPSQKALGLGTFTLSGY